MAKGETAALPPAERTRLLDEAEGEGLSVRAVRSRVRELRPPDREESPQQKGDDLSPDEGEGLVAGGDREHPGGVELTSASPGELLAAMWAVEGESLSGWSDEELASGKAWCRKFRPLIEKEQNTR